MKKIFLSILIFSSFFITIAPIGVFAANDSVTVEVTESIPGAGCVEKVGGDATKRKYTCTIESGFTTVQKMFGGLIKYATFLTALIGVLMIVFSGLQYSTSAGDTDAQKHATERIVGLIGGLILLFLTGFILNTIAPWIYS